MSVAAYRVGHSKVGRSLYAFKSLAGGGKEGKLVPMRTNYDVARPSTTQLAGI